MLIIFLSLCFFAYLLGSISCAILVSWILGFEDPRKMGSKNAGATNVLRIAGKKAAILTFIGDFLKGIIPILLAEKLGLNIVLTTGVGVFVILGHLYPIYFHFKGGKGVATTLGVVIAMSWKIGLLSLLTWSIIALLYRYASLASIMTVILIPIYDWYYYQNFQVCMLFLAIALLLILKHKQNIINLIKGMERKIGKPEQKY